MFSTTSGESRKFSTAVTSFSVSVDSFRTVQRTKVTTDELFLKSCGIMEYFISDWNKDPSYEPIINHLKKRSNLDQRIKRLSQATSSLHGDVEDITLHLPMEIFFPNDDSTPPKSTKDEIQELWAAAKGFTSRLDKIIQCREIVLGYWKEIIVERDEIWKNYPKVIESDNVSSVLEARQKIIKMDDNLGVDVEETLDSCGKEIIYLTNEAIMRAQDLHGHRKRPFPG